MQKKLVLAYSGGLDTSYCLKYLNTDRGFEVHTVLINTGGFSKAELEEIETKARLLGAFTHTTLNKEKEYYEKCIKYLIYGNVLKNGTYPLSVSSERIIQAQAVIEFAKKTGARYIAHGSTGAGNDQIRFDIMIRVLAPEIEIISPIRDLQVSRDAEIEYLKKQKIDLNFNKMAYSINKGLWGTSIGGKETLNSKDPLPEEAYPSKLCKTANEQLSITFNHGEIAEVNGKSFENRVDAIREIEAFTSPYAIGRDIHIGDTIIGIKGRVAFEAAAPLVIIKSHQTLEKHVLGKWQLYWKDQLANWYGMLLHEAQYLDPVMRDIESFLESSQKRVSGTVYIQLSPYHFSIEGIESDYDLMNSGFGDYGEINRAWTGEDVKGFTKILSIQSSLYYEQMNK